MKLTVLIHCPDTKGILNTVTALAYRLGGNIIYLDQHVDQKGKIFFMRMESEFKQKEEITAFKKEFSEKIALQYSMKWSIHLKENKPRMALFVSKYKHCLYDLLSRHQSGELKVDIPFIISNHEDSAYVAQQFNIPFYHIPVTKDTKARAEKEQLELLDAHKVDFIVLARYMQILSTTLISAFPDRIINIHHSFLPAFAGAKPYHAAYERGVKIIGATSHYATEDLDEGPIIEQGVIRVSHKQAIEDLIEKGRDLEKIVLAQAVQLHVKRKIIVCDNKTVIFS